MNKIKLNIDKMQFEHKPQDKEISGIVSRIKHNGDNYTEELTIEELAGRISRGCSFLPCAASGFTPEEKQTGAKWPGDDKFLSASLLCVDIDNKGEKVLTISRALDLMADHDITPAIIYTTFNNSEKLPKFRVIVKLADEITSAGEYRAKILKLINLFETEAPGATDAACKDPARLFFGTTRGGVVFSSKIETEIETINALQGAEMPPNDASGRNMIKDTGSATNANKGHLSEFNDTLDYESLKDEITEALEFIDPMRLDYNEWYQVLCACKNEGLSFNDFDTWSSRDLSTNERGALRYDLENNYKSWSASNGSAHNVTANTIFKMAYDNGWKPKRKEYTAPKSWAEGIAEAYIFSDPGETKAPADDTGAKSKKDNNTKNQFETVQNQLNDTPKVQEGQEVQEDIQAQEEAFNEYTNNIPLPNDTRPVLPAVNAAEYLESGAFDADIEYFKAFATRKMHMHPEIDKYLTLYPGLAVLGGISSLGKTTFTTQIIDKLLEAGESVIYFTIEQTPAEIQTKHIARAFFKEFPQSSLTNIDVKNGHDMSGKACKPEQMKYIRSVLTKKLVNYELVKCDFETTAADICEHVKRYLKNHPGVKPVVVIDYLQLLEAPADIDKNNIRGIVDENIKTLKRFQRDNELFVIALSSFNRSSNYEPAAYEDFKESGMIESTCDYVWSLQYTIKESDNFYELIGSRGGIRERSKRQKMRIIESEANKYPKQIVFKSLKSRNGKQQYNAFFRYYVDKDYFEPCEAPHFASIEQLQAERIAAQEEAEEKNTKKQKKDIKEELSFEEIEPLLIDPEE